MDTVKFVIHSKNYATCDKVEVTWGHHDKNEINKNQIPGGVVSFQYSYDGKNYDTIKWFFHGVERSSGLITDLPPTIVELVKGLFLRFQSVRRPVNRCELHQITGADSDLLLDFCKQHPRFADVSSVGTSSPPGLSNAIGRHIASLTNGD